MKHPEPITAPAEEEARFGDWTCPTGEHPSPAACHHPGYFGREDGQAPVPADAFEERDEEAYRLMTYGKAIFHAIWCTWHYEHEVDDRGMQHEKIEPLTALGQSLCDEAKRRLGDMGRAARVWQERAEALGYTAQEES